MASRGFAIYLVVGFLIISIIHCAQVWLNTFRLHCRAEIKPFMEILEKNKSPSGTSDRSCNSCSRMI